MLISSRTGKLRLVIQMMIMKDITGHYLRVEETSVGADLQVVLDNLNLDWNWHELTRCDNLTMELTVHLSIFTFRFQFL